MRVAWLSRLETAPRRSGRARDSGAADASRTPEQVQCSMCRAPVRQYEAAERAAMCFLGYARYFVSAMALLCILWPGEHAGQQIRDQVLDNVSVASAQRRSQHA